MSNERIQQEKTKPSLFLGICKTCGETYEARSVLEDLEGVTFQCKKVMCEGRVALVSAPDVVPLDEVFEKPPTRYH
jgi:hypothetical protein